MNESRKPGSLFFPLLLVAVGVLIFLINIGTVPGTTWQNLTQYWPVILIIGGLDGLYKRDGWIGPLVLIGFGTVLLLGNLHYITYSGFELLAKLWPILLVAIGLDVLLGHRGSVWNNLIRVALGVMLVIGILWVAKLSPSFNMGTKSVPFEQALDGATRSDLSFAVAVGEVNLSGGAEADLLASGTASLPREMELDPNYSAPKNGASFLSLEGNSLVIFPVHVAAVPWDFDFNSSIPMELTAELGVGELRVDLTDTQVENLKARLGVGQATITLPEGIDVDASVEGAVGELVIRVPKGSDVTIRLDKAIVGSSLPDGYTRVGNRVTGPQAASGAPEINLEVGLAIGSIVIQEID